MTTATSPEQRRAQGVAAKGLLEDETIKAVLAEVRGNIHSDWAAARFQRTRERLHAELRALDRVTQRLAIMAGQAPR